MSASIEHTARPHGPLVVVPSPPMPTFDSDLLLALYRAARELPTPEFQSVAIRMTRTRLRFASAVWTTGYRTQNAGGATLVPILAMSQTFETDPAGVDEWRAINRADKTIPIVFANPLRTQRIHTPLLFDAPEDAAMRDYARRFGRQNALITAMSDRGAPLAQWCSVYRPDADDQFSRSEKARCEALMKHLSQALHINRLLRHDPLARVAGTGDTAGGCSALVAPDGSVLSAQAGFVAACLETWSGFDARALPDSLMRDLLGPGRGLSTVRRTTFRLSPVSDLFLVTVSAAVDTGVPPRRLRVATLFAAGWSSKDIAASLGLSPATVRNHLATAYAEMGVHSRRQLAAALARVVTDRLDR